MRLMRTSNLLRNVLSSKHMRHFVAKWLCNSFGDANNVCVTNCFATNGINLVYHSKGIGLVITLVETLFFN